MSLMIIDGLMALSDKAFELTPQSRPPEHLLKKAKLIAHRGAHQGTCLENTWDAFRAAARLGIWGVELDVRWSRDRVPLVLHDPTPERIFPQAKVPVRQMLASDIREMLPQVPLLEDLVQEFKGALHFMIEVKEPVPDAEHRTCLQRILRPLEPGRDFHFLSLHPRLFDGLDFLSPSCLLPVAETNVAPLSRLALEKGWAGLSGHYLLLGDRLHRRHKQAGQGIGTGFINSQNLMFREINRGVEWLFTQRAQILKPALDGVLQSSAGVPIRPDQGVRPPLRHGFGPIAAPREFVIC